MENQLTREELIASIERNDFEVHQSRLKILLGDYPERFLRPYKDTTEAMILGHLTETILLESDKLEERFEIQKEMPPSGKVAECVLEVFEEKGDELDIDMEADRTFWVGKAHDIQLGAVTWSDDTRFNKFLEKQDYWKYLKERDPNKEPITQELYELGETMARGIASDPVCGSLFERNKNQEIMIQHTWRAEFSGVPCGGIIDVLVLDHAAQTARVWDIKTGGQGLYQAARKYRWDIQGSMYTEGLINDMPEGYEDYKVLNPGFIFVRTDEPTTPIVKYLSDIDMKTGATGVLQYKTADYGAGKPIQRSDRQIEGFIQLLGRYKFHQTTGQWAHRREYYDDEYKDYLNLW